MQKIREERLNELLYFEKNFDIAVKEIKRLRGLLKKTIELISDGPFKGYDGKKYEPK